MATSYDTIVIGLGAAGVTAATTLARAGMKVLGLEAQDRVGGRVHTVPFGDGIVELGAEWVHGSNPSIVYDTAVQNNITLLAQDLPLEVYFSNGLKPGQDEQDLFSDLVNRIFCFAEQASLEIEPLGVYCERKLMEYINNERQELLTNKELIAQVLAYSHELINNYNASNDWNDISAQEKYEEIDGHQHLSWHSCGYKTFFDILLNKSNGLPNLENKLNVEVVSIEWSEDPQRQVVVRCADGSVYTAENVIVTVSVGVLKERHATLFNPPLPEDKITAINMIAMGVMDKIELSFDSVWWPTNNAVFFGFIWKAQDKDSVRKEDIWMTKVFAASRTMGAKNVLTLWTSGEMAKVMETIPLHELKTKCRQLLQRFMGASINKVVPEPTDILRSTWFTNPFIRGSYTYDCLAAANYPHIRQDLARPLVDASGKPRVLFAGEATDEKHYSTVHGACDSGFREAMRLSSGKSKL